MKSWPFFGVISRSDGWGRNRSSQLSAPILASTEVLQLKLAVLALGLNFETAFFHTSTPINYVIPYPVFHRNTLQLPSRLLPQSSSIGASPNENVIPSALDHQFTQCDYFLNAMGS